MPRVFPKRRFASRSCHVTLYQIEGLYAVIWSGGRTRALTTDAGAVIERLGLELLAWCSVPHLGDAVTIGEGKLFIDCAIL